MTRVLGLLATLLLVLASWSPAAGQFSSVRVQVVDVGQADGILIRTPNQEWVLIDAGTGRRFADSLPTHFGVDQLALAIGTHRHLDHIGGMRHVIRNVPVALFLGDTTEYAHSSVDDSLRAAIIAHSVPVRAPAADTFDLDGVRFIVLPPTPFDAHNENNNSVVVRLEFGEFTMLFTGDAENAQRAAMVEGARELLEAKVLKASHHGSHNGTDSLWLAAVNPDHVVLSAGVHGRYKHPHAEAVDAYMAVTGGRLFCTNRHGTVRVYGFPDGRVRMFTQRQSDKSCTYDGTHY